MSKTFPVNHSFEEMIARSAADIGQINSPKDAVCMPGNQGINPKAAHYYLAHFLSYS
jgi:hypothetical protein